MKTVLTAIDGRPFAVASLRAATVYGARARPWRISFSSDPGGYCDDWGCPDDFWDLPVFYGPVSCGAIGMTARSIIATGMAAGNSGSMAAGAGRMARGASAAGGAQAGSVRR